ncbi:hypothetical protein [Larkinella rosea]|uniref:Outer membrane protein beta-barrel domain-containing protein n=1 Tax=Larkinella rosea TaxID=2025312 RepID=A0A3P1BSB3_9BACT|nr:hypothetical protein [Larkinella rosea]RRB03991.1 hypothetical protein EHT25_10700 [Larkinella rosea]
MKHLPFFFMLISSATVLAQSSFQPLTRTVDLSVAGKSDFATLALTINQLHGIGRSNRFRLGYGLRLTSAFSGPLNYITAPARLTSGTESIVALFTENILTNLDTLRLNRTRATSLNASIHIEYALTKRFEAGINIDAIGVTFGGSQSGVFYANAPDRSSLTGTVQSAHVTRFNVLLISDSDRGSLNSEAYVRYRFTPKVSLRGGIGFQFNEYTTDRKLTFENDRFRSKNAMPMLALAYHF